MLFRSDREASIKSDTLLPSFIESVAIRNEAKGAILDVIHAFANDPAMSSKDAAAKIVKGISAL